MSNKLTALCACLLLSAGNTMAATVTQDQIKALPVGTTYVGMPTGEFNKGATIQQNSGAEVRLVRTEEGYTYIHAHAGRGAAGAQTVPCNTIGKSGGTGNATIGCALVHGQVLRFEWLDLDNVKYEYWFSKKDMAGLTQNKPARASATLTKKQPVRSGEVIPPGSYKVSFELPDGANWPDVNYKITADGGFVATKSDGTSTIEGTWEEIDGDFCHIYKEVHCYSLISQDSDGLIHLQYKPADSSEDPDQKATVPDHKATWTPN